MFARHCYRRHIGSMRMFSYLLGLYERETKIRQHENIHEKQMYSWNVVVVIHILSNRNRLDL